MCGLTVHTLGKGYFIPVASPDGEPSCSLRPMTEASLCDTIQRLRALGNLDGGNRAPATALGSDRTPKPYSPGLPRPGTHTGQRARQGEGSA